MYLKIIGSIIFGATTVSLITWGGISAHKSSQYNSKMSEYNKDRNTFLNKKLGGENFMCHLFTAKECLDENNKFKEYLPDPYDKKSWELLYENWKGDTSIKKENFLQVKDPETLKDYCYGEIKESIKQDGNKEQKNSYYFDVAGSSNSESEVKKAHNKCVLTGEGLEKLIGESN